MSHIEIVQGMKESVEGARLNRMALEEVAQTLAGTTDETMIEQTLAQMWQLPNNRFSHQYAYEARRGEKTLGIITCYPTEVLERLGWPTLQTLVGIRKWPLLSHAIRNLQTVWNLIHLKEGRKDEFHIASLAALPESRGMGIGTLLIGHAEEEARKQRFRKTSLTVKKSNYGARRLYERLGYTVVDKIDREPFYLYRMAKLL
ncbi:GNAT family N-acetyltransferase [Paenibacillus sp. 598K]|uniref:GNAT family N-acetyltransferase n=1 Tax=Paenibacillus sp. 598K TaxID=1117987 RepID=UPI000FFE3808|nr:GNAT family N-acetyltransferase [Paenibacillus sp. 598K]